MLKILTVPNKVLVTPSSRVKKITPRLTALIEAMEKTLSAQEDPPGVGLAAPQIGEPLRLFIVKSGPKKPTKVVINPKILKHSATSAHYASRNKTSKKNKKESSLEGCLSVPRIWSPVQRSSKILLEYETVDGVKRKEWLMGFEAVIIQHEIDHLDGVLFTQRALEQGKVLYEEVGDELKKLKGV